MSYYVIKILNNKEIAINYGKVNGARVGTEINIFESTKGEEIIFNGKNYGKLRKFKDRLEIVMVYNDFSICKKIKTEIREMFSPLTLKKETFVSIELDVIDIPKNEQTTYRSFDKIKPGDIVEIEK